MDLRIYGIFLILLGTLHAHQVEASLLGDDASLFSNQSGSCEPRQPCDACVAAGCDFCWANRRCMDAKQFGGLFQTNCQTSDQLKRWAFDLPHRASSQEQCQSDPLDQVMDATVLALRQTWASSLINADAESCAGWSLGREEFQSAESLTKGAKKASNEDYEKYIWSQCLSAMMRFSLQLFEDGDTDIGSPPICAALGADCEMETVAESDFHQMRQEYGVEDTVKEALRDGTLVILNPGAGKSGSTFMETTVEPYVMFKLGLKTGFSNVDEVATLKRMMKGQDGDVSLPQHLQRQSGGSLLNVLYGLYKLTLSGTTKWALTMADATYGLHPIAKQQGWAFEKYDLKGKSRSEGSFSKEGASTGSNGDFEKNRNNNVGLNPERCEEVRARLLEDVHFLERYNVIDYSFLLAFAEVPLGKDLPENWMRLDNDPSSVVTISIIDYLNDYSVLKQMESTIQLDHSVGKFDRFGFRMFAYFDKICPSAPSKLLDAQPFRAVVLPPSRFGMHWGWS